MNTNILQLTGMVLLAIGTIEGSSLPFNATSNLQSTFGTQSLQFMRPELDKPLSPPLPVFSLNAAAAPRPLVHPAFWTLSGTLMCAFAPLLIQYLLQHAGLPDRITAFMKGIKDQTINPPNAWKKDPLPLENAQDFFVQLQQPASLCTQRALWGYYLDLSTRYTIPTLVLASLLPAPASTLIQMGAGSFNMATLGLLLYNNRSFYQKVGNRAKNTFLAWLDHHLTKITTYGTERVATVQKYLSSFLPPTPHPLCEETFVDGDNVEQALQKELNPLDDETFVNGDDIEQALQKELLEKK